MMPFPHTFAGGAQSRQHLSAMSAAPVDPVLTPSVVALTASDEVILVSSVVPGSPALELPDSDVPSANIGTQPSPRLSHHPIIEIVAIKVTLFIHSILFGVCAEIAVARIRRSPNSESQTKDSPGMLGTKSRHNGKATRLRPLPLHESMNQDCHARRG